MSKTPKTNYFYLRRSQDTSIFQKTNDFKKDIIFGNLKTSDIGQLKNGKDGRDLLAFPNNFYGKFMEKIWPKTP